MKKSFFLSVLILAIGSIVDSFHFKSFNRLPISRLFMSGEGKLRKFAKYEGLGNDFILIDNRHSENPVYTPEQSVQLCNRNFGIGADGVIFALPGKEGFDYTMRIYNSDGSEPQMCGNGIRCLAKFLQELESKKNEEEVTYRIATNAGPIIPKITTDGLVTVDMGKPILEPLKVPTTLAPTRDDMVIDAEIHALNTVYKSTAVSMGNPHSVIYIDDLDTMEPSFPVIGPILEKHSSYPQRVNTEFVQVLSRNHVRVKVWERGAGPTLACGTGACAVTVAGVLIGRTERNLRVSLPGGDLLIEYRESDGRVYMTGPARPVFHGVIDLPL